jgi:hypothetical protein
VLAALAFLMLASIAPTLLAIAFDERTFNGINVWIKPFKFEVSSALHLATLALFWPYMDARFRRGRGMRAAVWVVAAVFVFEVGYIAYRASLAEASHFNNSTPQAISLYAAMGIAIGLVMAITLWVGIQILRSREGDISPTLRLAIGVGLILGSVLASVSGGYMSSTHGHWVGGIANDAGGLSLFGWSRTGGDLRVAHFFGLHIIQVLPIVGWIVQRSPAGRACILGVALVWTVATALILLQAIQGKPFLPL